MCRPAHHEGSAAPRRGLAGLRCPRRSCCLWPAAMSRAARVGQPRAARRVLRLASLDPAEAAATWPPALRRPVKVQHCPASTRVRPSCWRRRERWSGAPRARTSGSSRRVPMPSHQLWRPCARCPRCVSFLLASAHHVLNRWTTPGATLTAILDHFEIIFRIRISHVYHASCSI